MDIIELIKVIIIGIVEGITEWLPISSTGHMLLVDEFIHMNVTPEFREMFLYVIQLGAILAVIILFWNKMWPFQSKKKNGSVIKKETFVLWFKVIIACIPGFVAYLLLDFVDNCYVVAAALIVYGVLFIVIETGTAAASRESKRSRRYRIRMRSSSACFRLCRSFRAPRAAVLQS